MVIRFLALVTLLLFSQLTYGQSLYCAIIDKYDSLSQIKSSHTAKVIINQTVLESVEWANNEKVDTNFFGTTIFYGSTSTFNDAHGVLFRITLRGENEECFEHTLLRKCKALLKSKEKCGSKTDSNTLFCWKH